MARSLDQARDRRVDVVGLVVAAGEPLADLRLGQLAPAEHLEAVDVGVRHGPRQSSWPATRVA